MAVLYFVFAIMSLFSTAIVNKVGNVKITMSMGAFCYSFWIASFILPSIANENEDLGISKSLIQVIIIVTAGINGAGAGILWVSQGKYISECACDENKGFFNSYFWGFFMGSNILGNIIAALVFKSGAK